MPSNYVVQSRYILLTYSQCGELDPFRVCNHLGSLGAECIIGRELHQDGGSHLHAFVDFGRKYRSRRVDVFDVGGFHPNISPSRGNPARGYDYAIKDGEVCAGGLARPEHDQDSSAADADIWSRALEATNRDDFFALLESGAGKNLILNFPAISRFADWRFMDKPREYVTPEGTFDTSSYPELQGWVERELGVNSGGKCTSGGLAGPSDLLPVGGVFSRYRDWPLPGACCAHCPRSRYKEWC